VYQENGHGVIESFETRTWRLELVWRRWTVQNKGNPILGNTTISRYKLEDEGVGMEGGHTNDSEAFGARQLVLHPFGSSVLAKSL